MESEPVPGSSGPGGGGSMLDMDINADKLEPILEGPRGWSLRGLFTHTSKHGDGDMFPEHSEIAKSVFSFLPILSVPNSVFQAF